MFPAGQRSAGEAWSKWIDQERHSLVMLLLLEPAARAGPYKYAFNVSVSNKFTMQICRTNYIATCRCTGGAPLSSCKCGAPLSRRCLRKCLSCHLASEVRGRVLHAPTTARKLASACSTSATRCSFFTARAVLHTYIHIYIYTYNIYTLSRPGASGPVVDEATTFRISVTTFTVSSVSEEGQDSSPTACCKAAGCGMLVPVDLGRSAMQVRSISWLLPFFCAVELSICTIYLMHQCVRIPYHYNADLPDKSYRKLQMHRRC